MQYPFKLKHSLWTVLRKAGYSVPCRLAVYWVQI